MVDENRVTGALHQAEGAIKEGFGKLTGDKKTEAEGARTEEQRQGRERRWRRQGHGSGTRWTSNPQKPGSRRLPGFTLSAPRR